MKQHKEEKIKQAKMPYHGTRNRNKWYFQMIKNNRNGTDLINSKDIM